MQASSYECFVRAERGLTGERGRSAGDTATRYSRRRTASDELGDPRAFTPSDRRRRAKGGRYCPRLLAPARGPRYAVGIRSRKTEPSPTTDSTSMRPDISLTQS